MAEYMVGDVISVQVGAGQETWLRMSSGWINQYGSESRSNEFPTHLPTEQVTLLARNGHPVLARHDRLMDYPRAGWGN